MRSTATGSARSRSTRNIAGVLVSGVRLDVHVATLAVAKRAETGWLRHASTGPRSKVVPQETDGLCGCESGGPGTTRRALPPVDSGWLAKSERIHGCPRPQSCNRNDTPYNESSANGKQCLNCLSLLRGQVQYSPKRSCHRAELRVVCINMEVVIKREIVRPTADE